MNCLQCKHKQAFHYWIPDGGCRVKDCDCTGFTSVVDIYETNIPPLKMNALVCACGIYYPHELDNWPEIVEQLWYEDYNFREENNFKVL